MDWVLWGFMFLAWVIGIAFGQAGRRHLREKVDMLELQLEQESASRLVQDKARAVLQEEVAILRQVAAVRLVVHEGERVALDMTARAARHELNIRGGEPLVIGGFHTRRGFSQISMVEGENGKA